MKKNGRRNIDLGSENMDYPLVNYRNFGKSQFLMAKSTINGTFFNSYVSLPEGT